MVDIDMAINENLLTNIVFNTIPGRAYAPIGWVEKTTLISKVSSSEANA